MGDSATLTSKASRIAVMYFRIGLFLSFQPVVFRGNTSPAEVVILINPSSFLVAFIITGFEEDGARRRLDGLP